MIKRITLAIIFGLFMGNAQAKPKERPKTYHICTSSDTPENILACAIYFEARSEGEKGMEYVGNVILNRRNHEQYPSKLSKVVYQKHQFSYISKRGIRVQDKMSWDLAKKISRKLLSTSTEKRRLTDGTKGAIMFAKKGRKPYWAKKYQRSASYGKHIFYREKSK